MSDLITVRASSFADFADCPARWYAKHIEGKRLPSGPAAIIGKAIHAGTAAFDTSTMNGDGLSIDDAAGALVDTLNQPDEEVDWSADDKWTPREAESVSLVLHSKYCREIAPKRRYVEVEADLGSVEIAVDTAGVTVCITGHTDRVRVDDAGREGISDIKSGGRIVSTEGKVDTKGHAYQLAAYSLLRQVSSGKPLTAPAEIIGLNTGKTPVAQRVAVGQTNNVESTLLGVGEKPGLIQAIAHMARDGIFFGNPKSMLCSEKFCPAYKVCAFRR